MMRDVNWWLMVLSFLLGLVLSLALMIRRVKREIPEYATLTAGTAGTAGAAGAAGAAAAGGAAAAKFADTSTEKIPTVTEEPYGPGSARVAGATAPSGYDIKGNEDSMLYHTLDSPSYKQTSAEVWFRDVETAEKAGFSRWDGGKSRRGEGDR
jgi:uncharacterized membrane protein ArfC